MRLAAAWIATALAFFAAGHAAAQTGQGAETRQERIAAACAFAPMTATARIEACERLLEEMDLAPSARAMAEFGRSKGLRHTGDDAAAAAALDEAIRLKPDLAPALLTRSALALSANDLDVAISDASRAIEADRRNAAGYLLRAEAYLRRREPAFALGDMDDAIRIAPNAPRLRLIRAYANLALDRPEAAVGDARAALRVSPDMTAAYLVRARAYLTTGAFARAGADAERAAELSPDDPQAWDAATIAFTELAKFDRAEAAANRLVALEPASPDSLNARCWVRALTPEPQAAVPDCDAALKAEPDHYQAYDSRAFAYWQLGELEAARADLARAAELAPDFWDWGQREERFKTVLIRRYLKSLGLYGGPLDGEFDDMSETEAAIRNYEAAEGLPTTGAPTAALLSRLAEEDGVN